MKKHKKIRIAIIFGGRSAEHEISIQSVRNIVKALDKEKYEPVLIGINKDGEWVTSNTRQLFSNKQVVLDKNKKNILTEVSGNLKKIDVVFPVLHGPFGEDGTVQGLLKLAGVPFVGAGVLGSAIGMDKDVMKRLLRDAGLPTNQFLTYKSFEKGKISFDKIKQALGLPFFVKPANLGSSVGITKIHNKQELLPALESAFMYDSKIIVEEYIKGIEIECSVLGNDDPVASMCGEITPNHEFYSYEAKYLDKDGAKLSIPANISAKVSKKIQEIAVEAFKVLCCEGMARLDFFVAAKDRIVINEINTIPGFTSISMYPKLWEVSGISYSKLIDTLIELAIERYNKEQKLHTSIVK